MSKKPTEKPPSRSNANEALKYSGMAFQIVIMLGIAVFFGQKLDAQFDFDKPYLTALCAITALPLILYYILKDLL